MKKMFSVYRTAGLRPAVCFLFLILICLFEQGGGAESVLVSCAGPNKIRYRFLNGTVSKCPRLTVGDGVSGWWVVGGVGRVR